jgi:2',3'-cyclic-nucleotide 2'-phosphodiesterase / 3'-nucleotidase
MVKILQLSDGRPFENAKSYKVAVNSYRGSGGGSHLSRGAGLTREEAAGRLIRSSDSDFRLLLTDWIRKQGTIGPSGLHNWKTIPEDWTRVASARDLKRLLPDK